MKLFEAVKEAVTARSAAEYYGIKVGRNGMAVCPFHPDKNPSMKLDKRYHCQRGHRESRHRSGHIRPYRPGGKEKP